MLADFTRNRVDAIVTRNTRGAFSAVIVAIASLVVVVVVEEEEEAAVVGVFLVLIDVVDSAVKKREREREK